jgi:hypothetical protein
MNPPSAQSDGQPYEDEGGVGWCVRFKWRSEADAKKFSYVILEMLVAQYCDRQRIPYTRYYKSIFRFEDIDHAMLVYMKFS